MKPDPQMVLHNQPEIHEALKFRPAKPKVVGIHVTQHLMKVHLVCFDQSLALLGS
jgi:hypothetical protein